MMESATHTIPGRPTSTKSKLKNAIKGKKLTPLEDAPPPPNLNNITISDKKDLTEAVRRVNPTNLHTANSVFWNVEGNLKTSTIDDSSVRQQLNIVENGVNYSARRLNDLKVNNERLTHDLKAKLDELDEQKKNYETLDAMQTAKTEEALRIKQLREEIEDVEQETEKKIHYTRQLEHMMMRLKKNQLKFDAYMVGMEEAMSGLSKECLEVRLLRRGLDAGYSKAVQVLDETRGRIANARKDRESMLDQRSRDVKNAQQLHDWLRRREEMKAKMEIELRGDLSREEESFLRSQISEKQEETRSLQKANEESNKRLQAMDDAFAKLKQVTGVSSLDEMLEKFSSQRNNKRELEKEVKEAEKKLAEKKQLLAVKERLFQDMKSSNVGLAELSREMKDKLEADISAAKNEFKLTKACTDRLGSVLLGLQQGSVGMLQRVAPYLGLSEGGVFELTQGEDDQFLRETLEALATVEQVSAKMGEVVNGGAGESGSTPLTALKSFSYDEDGDEGLLADISAADKAGSPWPQDISVSSASNNVRVKSRKVMKESELVARHRDEDSFASGNGPDAMGDDDALDREDVTSRAVKTDSKRTEESEARKKKWREEPPSRLLVKAESDRDQMRCKRNEEVEARKKKLLERMAMGKSQTATGDDLGGIADLAIVKAQKHTADRLCTTKSLPTLPDGITLRDDVMKKSKAFLQIQPNLT